MKAYKGVVENGVVVVIGARLPEGTAVTVTVGEGELVRATIASALDGGSKKLGKKIKLRLRPLPGLSLKKLSLKKLGTEKLGTEKLGNQLLGNQLLGREQLDMGPLGMEKL